MAVVNFMFVAIFVYVSSENCLSLDENMELRSN